MWTRERWLGSRGARARRSTPRSSAISRPRRMLDGSWRSAIILSIRSSWSAWFARSGAHFARASEETGSEETGSEETGGEFYAPVRDTALRWFRRAGRLGAV